MQIMQAFVVLELLANNGEDIVDDRSRFTSLHGSLTSYGRPPSQAALGMWSKAISVRATIQALVGVVGQLSRRHLELVELRAPGSCVFPLAVGVRHSVTSRDPQHRASDPRIVYLLRSHQFPHMVQVW